jgi:hypothetical protein
MMAVISMGVGVVLIGLGLGGYFYTEREHWTALIPVFLGAVLVILGALALNDRLRKHSMHTAMLLALIGLIGSGWRAAKGIGKLVGGETVDFPAAPWINLAIALCCAAFVALGIKSFVDARRRRQAQG